MNGYPEEQWWWSVPLVSLRTGKPLRKSKIQNVAWIYGLFNKDMVCFYVGQTLKPHERRKKHTRKYPTLEFMIIRCCHPTRASKIESQIISAYKRNGQASENKALKSGNSCASVSTAPIIRHTKNGKEFCSLYEAALFFKCSETTIKNHLIGKYPSFDKFYPIEWISQSQLAGLKTSS